MCNSAALVNIAKACGVNPSGFKQKLALTFVEEIDTIAAATNLVVSTDITFEVGGSFRIFDISSRDQDFSVEPLGEADNPSGYKSSLKCRIHSKSAAALNSISATAGAPMIVIGLGLSTSYNRIIGAKDNPAYLKVIEKETSTDGYLDCEVMWERSSERPYFYTGTLPN